MHQDVNSFIMLGTRNAFFIWVYMHFFPFENSLALASENKFAPEVYIFSFLNFSYVIVRDS